MSTSGTTYLKVCKIISGPWTFKLYLSLDLCKNYYSHLVFAVMYHYKVITLHFRVIVTEWYILACKVKTRLMMVNCLLCRQTWCQNFLQSPLRYLATDLWMYGRRSMIWNYNWMVRNSKFSTVIVVKFERVWRPNEQSFQYESLDGISYGPI